MVSAVRLQETFERLDAVKDDGNGTVASIGVKRKGRSGFILKAFKIANAVCYIYLSIVMQRPE